MVDRRETDEIKSQLEAQGDLLRQILAKMAEHRIEHATVDPSVKQLVEILQGIKFLKGTALILASLIGSLFGAWALVKDHIKW